MLAHNVFFLLKDRSDEAKRKLIAAAKTHLTNHPGTRFFACGTLAEELDRPVNDREFDVALHLVFDSMESHNLYQDAPRHHQFVNENRDNWATVRVFDSMVEGAS